MTTTSPSRNLRLLFRASPGANGYQVALHRSHDHDELARGEMPWPAREELEDRCLTPLRAFLGAPVTPTFQETLGDRITELLPPPVQDALAAECLKDAVPALPRTLGVVALSSPRWFAALPWEFLRVPTSALDNSREFLALKAHWSITRNPEQELPVPPVRAEPSRVLIVCADPRTAEYPPLAHLEDEIAAIQGAFASRRGAVVEVLRHAASAALRARLKEFSPHILHYVGHGKERATGGVLALHDGSGVEEIYGADLADWLLHASTRLVVLSACHTAAVSHSANSVAQAVLKAGVPAAVAMQLAMRDSSSRLFTSALYRRLNETGCIVKAVWEARQAIRGMGPDWAVPTLHLIGGAGPLFAPTGTVPPGKDPAIIESSLPAPLDRFIGRKDERRDLIALLKKPLTRCVTLTGAAGIGKTRLAAHIGFAAAEFAPDGVIFVELQDVSEPDRILAQIADALSLELAPNRDILDSILRALEGRRALMILDNFEHIRSAASHIRALLEKLPELKALVTSREPLNIRGEYKIGLDPLPAPPVGAAYQEIKSSDSVRLLVERAKYANLKFKLTADNAEEAAALCRALDGLPLAIEIVAAQIRNRPLARVLSELHSELLDTKSRIEGLPARQQSLRAAFDWSFQRLAENERTLFVQLSLFETPFSLEDAREVCTGDNLDAALESLRDRSLLQYDPQDVARPYRMLVPLREYAASHLGPLEEAARSRFVAAFTARAQRLYDSYFAKQMERGALEAFRRDLENFRSAWRWVEESGHEERIADLGLAVVAFAPMLLGRSSFDHWMDPIERALRSLKSDARLALLFNIRARLANVRGDFARALACQEEVLSFLSGAGDTAQVSDALSTLAWFAMRARDFAAAERHARAAIPQAQAAGDVEAEAMALCVLARSALSRDVREAERCARASLALFQQAGVVRGQAHANMALGSIAEQEGDVDGASRRYLEAIRLCWEQRDEIQTVMCLDVLAKLHASQRPGPFATRLLADVAHMQRLLGLPETLPRGSQDHIQDAPIARSKTVADMVMYVLSESIA